MKLMCLLDINSTRHYTGYTLEQLINSTGMVTYDRGKRQVWVGKHLAQTFTNDWTNEELASHMRKSALSFFTSQLGWKFFQEYGY